MLNIGFVETAIGCDRLLLNFATMLTLLLILFAASPEVAMSQNVTGSIVGTLTDPSGAVAPGGTITVINTQTQSTRTVTTHQVTLPLKQYEIQSLVVRVQTP
jgi:hypothetical protein